MYKLQNNPMNKNRRAYILSLRFSSLLLLLPACIGLNSVHANQDDQSNDVAEQQSEEIELILHPIDHKSSIIDLDYKTHILNYSIEDLNIITEKENEVLIELAADVLFDFDKANLKPSAVASLETVAKRIRETSRGDVRIEGHTDSKGSNEYNQTLSEKRAISVRDWFVSDGGLSKVQFVTKGFGELKPVVSNTTEKGADNPIGRQRNRRVEIIIKTVD